MKKMKNLTAVLFASFMIFTSCNDNADLELVQDEPSVPSEDIVTETFQTSVAAELTEIPTTLKTTGISAISTKPAQSSETSEVIDSVTTPATTSTTTKTETAATAPPQQTNTTSATSKTTAAKSETTAEKTESAPVITEKAPITEVGNGDDDLHNMPEIVFALSYEYDSVGYYINRNGEIRSFSFIGTDLEELNYGIAHNILDIDTIVRYSADTNYSAVSKEELQSLYEALLQVSRESTLSPLSDPNTGEFNDVHQQYLGNYVMYGMRNNGKNSVETIVIGEYGDSIFISSDPTANELLEKLKLIIPDPSYLAEYHIKH